MATERVSDRVRELARHLDIEESEVLQQALETGVETLYRDMVITRYLDGDLPREEAVDELGDALTTALGWVNDAVTAPGIGA